MANSDADRAAFLFNLTDNFKWAERLGADRQGEYQTVNGSSCGPWFGAGPDLKVFGDLNEGTACQFAYGEYIPFDIGLTNIMLGYSNQPFAIDTLEVFTVQPVQPVPEPTSLALFGTGMVGFVAQRLRSKQHRCHHMTLVVLASTNTGNLMPGQRPPPPD